jgi:hypothetical protein
MAPLVDEADASIPGGLTDNPMYQEKDGMNPLKGRNSSQIHPTTRLDPGAPVFSPFLSNTNVDDASSWVIPVAPKPITSCYCTSSSISCRLSCALYSNILLPLPPNIPDSVEPSIRLICLKAGNERDVLECTMFTTTLSERVKFSALSYVWGNESKRHPLTVNGQLISVAENLYAALLHLRSPRSHKVLWVDAICINQTDLGERSYQVEQMPKVYAAAEEVIAWLGEARNNSDLAMDYIANHGSQKKSGVQRGIQLSNEIQDALNHLWARPYWTRAWVVQELASARRSKHRCMFHCGSRSVSYNVCHKFLTSFISRVLVIEDDPGMQPRRMFTLSSSASHMPFLEVLCESAFLESTDPRDRIYGIRGISPQFYRDTIRVDYNIEFHRLCSKFMMHYITKERNLDLLSCFHTFPSVKQYPSWLCDLRNRNNGISHLTYWAAAGRKANARFANGILYAKGVQISIVEDVKGPYQLPNFIPPNAFYGHHPGMQKLEELKESALQSVRVRYPNESSQNGENRFWRMVARDHHGDRGSSKVQSQTPPQLWQRCCDVDLMAGGGTWEDRRNFNFIFERMLGRCFFTTADQHIGLGPPNLQKGDVVCVLYGCSVCIILREASNGYNFVGPAYVDGAMCGEYVPPNGSAVKGLKESKFSIR